MAFKKRWQPTAAQKREYAERMRNIESAKNTTPDGYTKNCTGDACKGDEIAFFNPAKDGDWFFGKIVKESYGAEKQQHTFTIELENGESMIIKGRNLYKNTVYRKVWVNENERLAVIKEKHERGDKARAAREVRKAQNLFE